MRIQVTLWIIPLVILCGLSPCLGGPVMGPDAQNQLEALVARHGGVYLNFDQLAAGTQLDDEYASSGVRFRSIRNPDGSSISKPLVAISYGGSIEISGTPSWGSGSDGRVAYEISFDNPRQWAGLARHWDNYYTITKFYNPSGQLIHSFQNIQGQSGWNKTFLGYIVDSSDTNQWISRIECDGVLLPGNRQVGYSDDLYFGVGADQNTQPMVITSASLRFSSKLGDKFTVNGVVEGLSLSGAQSVVFEADAFSQEIPVDRFVQAGTKHTFTGGKGAPGLSTLVLDATNGKFTATVTNVSLSGFTNPLPVKLTLGQSEKCAVIQLVVKGNTWSFSAAKNPQYPCDITEVPQSSPRAIFVKTPSQFRIEAKVNPNPKLDTSSLTLYAVDQNLGLMSDPICTLLDNGSSANGDSASGDNVYSCLANIRKDAPGVAWLAVRAKLGGTYVFSPSLKLGIVAPLTEQTIQETLDAQDQVTQIWKQKVKRNGNTKKTRTQTAMALKKVKGIKSAKLSKDSFVIYLEFAVGMRGSVMLYPENLPGSGTELPQAREKVQSEHPPTLSKGSIEPASPPSEEPLASGTLTTGTTTCRVGNCRAFIYSPFRNEFDYDTGQKINDLLNNSPKEKMDVTFLKNDECTVDALFLGMGKGSYGTVVINSHGIVGYDNQIEIMTKEKVTPQSLMNPVILYGMADGALTWTEHDNYKKGISGWFYSFRPKFISDWVRGGFKNGITLMASCKGAANGSMAEAFFGKGMKAYFGMTGYVWEDYLADCSDYLFYGLVNEEKNTEVAYADVPHLDGDPDPKHYDPDTQFVMMAYPVPLSYDCTKQDLSKYKKGMAGLMWHVVYETIWPDGHKTYIDNKLASFGSEFYDPKQPGTWTGNTFTQQMDYTDKIKEQHESLTVIVNNTATVVTYFWYLKTYKQGTLIEKVEFEVTDIPIDYTNDGQMVFSVNGLETCNKVANFEYSRQSTDSGGTTTIGIPNDLSVPTLRMPAASI